MTMIRLNRYATTALGMILTVLTGLVTGYSDSPAQTTLTFEGALEIAMENSPEIKSTKLALERSRSMLDAQTAALKSQFNLRLSPFNYSSDRTFNTFLSDWGTTETKSSLGTFTISQPIKATDGTLALTNRFSWQDSYSDYNDIRRKTYDNNLFLSFTQPIFTYNRTKLETRELELDLETTLLSFAIQKLSLERNVAQRFYTVYQNSMNYNISLEEQKNQEQSYQIIKNKVDAGLAAREELYQAELNRATSKSTVQNRLVTLENSLDTIKQLIGLPLTDIVAIETDVRYEMVDVPIEKAQNEALKNRMELRQHKINIENAKFNLIRTEAQNEFKGDITLSYGVIGTDEQFGNMFDAPTKKQAVGLSIDIPLWDWGEKKARMKASQATVKQRILTLDEEIVSIDIGIRQACRNLDNLVNQIDIARQSVTNAELTYDINLERYKNGDLTSMDLNLYQTQLSNRKMTLIQSQIDYKLALLDLKIQTLWDFERNEPVIPEEIK